MRLEGSIATTWSDLVDTAAALVDVVAARLKRSRTIGLTLGEMGSVVGPHGEPLETLDLAGATARLKAPRAWFFRTELTPAPIESAPFLDAFAAQQIERVTPWREQDVHAAVECERIPEDPTRIRPVLTVTPKHLVESFVTTLRQAGCARIVLSAGEGSGLPDLVVAGSAADASPRRGVELGLAGFAIGFAALALVSWRAAASAEAAAQGAQDALSAARAKLETMVDRARVVGGEGRPPVVLVLDELSAVLPDSAHLTSLRLDGDKLALAGVASSPPKLVSLLENSGRFADVAYVDAVREQRGGDSAFHLQMRVKGAGR
jgi:hypothetical protein